VHVSLIDGKVEVIPKSDGLIDPVRLFKATYDSGVSVAEMSVLARGQIVTRNPGEIALQVSASHTFFIQKNSLSPQLEAMTGKNVTVKGLLYQKAKGQKQALPNPLTINITEIQQLE
jgi:hypothetical protein